MTSLAVETIVPAATSVSITGEALSLDLVDGRTIQVPLAWFPRLLHATPDERANWRLIGGGEGVRWEALDEDISVESLIAGRGSQESQQSLAKWLKQRRA
jgi:hypothetical protein